MKTDESHKIEDLLRQHEFFKAFSPEEQQTLLQQGQLRSFAPGEVIFQLGDEGTYCFLILEGCVRVHLSTPDGKNLLVKRLQAGEIVGEMALLDGKPRSANITAETAGRFFRLERSVFLPMLEANPVVGLAVMKALTSRLRATTFLLESIALQSLPERLAQYLLQLKDNHGELSGSGVKVSLEIRQSDIADHLASSRESVNKIFNLWQQRGYIALLPHNACIIKDEDALLRIAHPAA
ncbi:MAG: Crp/Fnr family transcriptional regulator [Alphaproteobacteria bacterium]|nr:Crp/Fnr family transcriptional regulator [Alphaproteobacteria bacterium]